MPPFRATYREENEAEPHSISAPFRKRLLTAALKTEGVQAGWSRSIDRDSFLSICFWDYVQLAENDNGWERSRNAMTGNE